MLALVVENHAPQPGDNWRAFGLTRDEADGWPAARTVQSLGEMTAENITHIAIIRAEFAELFQQSAPRLLDEIPAGRRGAVVLVALRQCPWPEAVSDGRIYSFLATVDVFREVTASAGDCPLWQLCFRMLFATLNGRLPLDRLLVRQMPYPTLSHAADIPPIATIMAHRGETAHLRTALEFLDRLDSGPVATCIGLDEDSPAPYRRMALDFPNARFHHVQPSPAGPYVIRQELAEQASTDLLMLHDSDDVSCSDRVSALYGEMAGTGSDFVGSHELRVDEITGEVFAIRFPLDVVAALGERPGHALLHGTGLIRREAFLGCGGLSTDQIVANDTQFLFRAWFTMKIRNVNAFLYIRRRHARALTVAPETANGIPLRIELDRQWRADFERIKRGETTVIESSLRQRRNLTTHRLVSL